MKIRKIKKSQLNLTNERINTPSIFYKGQYKYEIGVVENGNIIQVIKEDRKSEHFEIEYFEII